MGVYVNKLLWESDASGIMFGELIFDEFDEEVKCNDSYGLLLLQQYDYIVSRINPEDRNFEQKLCFLIPNGFKLSDVFVVFSLKFPNLKNKPDFSRWENYISRCENCKIFSGKEIEGFVSKELLKITIEKMSISRYFFELPYHIAEKIYTKWVSDLVRYGRAFVLYDFVECKIKGFLGCMIDGNKYKNFILFGEGISFLILMKNFVISILSDKLDEMEFKISLRNLRALKVMSRIIGNREKKISFEFVFSKSNI